MTPATVTGICYCFDDKPVNLIAVSLIRGQFQSGQYWCEPLPAAEALNQPGTKLDLAFITPQPFVFAPSAGRTKTTTPATKPWASFLFVPTQASLLRHSARSTQRLYYKTLIAFYRRLSQKRTRLFDHRTNGIKDLIRVHTVTKDIDFKVDVDDHFHGGCSG
ncbi:MAG: hypothetical protein QF473_06510 [Planctomycetota bacterium]|jgi:hypothetical protein|nr:hypothetical protein [Planctomycetota bacterium]